MLEPQLPVLLVVQVAAALRGIPLLPLAALVYPGKGTLAVLERQTALTIVLVVAAVPEQLGYPLQLSRLLETVALELRLISQEHGLFTLVAVAEQLMQAVQ
jgi:hypothetical protein